MKVKMKVQCKRENHDDGHDDISKALRNVMINNVEHKQSVEFFMFARINLMEKDGTEKTNDGHAGTCIAFLCLALTREASQSLPCSDEAFS